MRFGTCGSPSVVRHALQQAALGRGVAELAAERFARIGQGVADQLLLFTAFRRRELPP